MEVHSDTSNKCFLSGHSPLRSAFWGPSVLGRIFFSHIQINDKIGYMRPRDVRS